MKKMRLCKGSGGKFDSKDTTEYTLLFRAQEVRDAKTRNHRHLSKLSLSTWPSRDQLNTNVLINMIIIPITIWYFESSQVAT